MVGVAILYGVAVILMVVATITRNNPKKQLARKAWIRVAVIFAIMASVNLLLNI